MAATSVSWRRTTAMRRPPSAEPRAARSRAAKLTKRPQIFTGSVLQATKPIFDKATYNWLVNGERGTPARIAGCQGPVVLLNDFADIALVSHAVGLSRYRHGAAQLDSIRFSGGIEQSKPIHPAIFGPTADCRVALVIRQIDYIRA